MDYEEKAREVAQQAIDAAVENGELDGTFEVTEGSLDAASAIIAAVLREAVEGEQRRYTVAELRQQIETPLPSYGAVQGILHSWLKEATRPSFQIRELSTESLVRVFYPQRLYPDVAKVVQERRTVLIVTGDMLYDRTTRTPTELVADRIEPMQIMSAGEFEKFFGSAPNFTGDMTTDEFIDEMRGE